MVHTVHRFLTERMSSAKCGPPPPFPLFIKAVLETSAHAARIAKTTAMYFSAIFSPKLLQKTK